MSFALGLDNQLTQCRAGDRAEIDDRDRQHSEKPDRTAFDQRFSSPGERFRRENTQQRVERRIPGDRISAALPIPASVDWTVRRVRVGPNEFQERAGRGRVRFDDFTYRSIVRLGSRVQFKDQLPGKEEAWYEIVAVEPRQPVLAGVPGTIGFELAEVLVKYKKDA